MLEGPNKGAKHSPLTVVRCNVCTKRVLDGESISAWYSDTSIDSHKLG